MIGLALDHGLAVEFEQQPEHTVRRRMHRAHVDRHALVVGVVGLDVTRPGPRPRFAGRALRRPAGSVLAPSLIRLGGTRSDPGVDLDLGLIRSSVDWPGSIDLKERLWHEIDGDLADAVVLAQGMALPLVRHEDAREVGCPSKTMPYMSIGLSLHRSSRSAPDLGDARDRWRIALRAARGRPCGSVRSRVSSWHTISKRGRSSSSPSPRRSTPQRSRQQPTLVAAGSASVARPTSRRGQHLGAQSSR